MPRTPKNPLLTKFCDLKGAVFCMDFGEAKRIRLTPIRDNEPKDTQKPPFKAGSGLNALVKIITYSIIRKNIAKYFFYFQKTSKFLLFSVILKIESNKS